MLLRLWCGAIFLMLVIGCEAPAPAKPQAASGVAFDAARMAEADALIAKAIENQEIPGAVLLVGLRDQTVYRKAYGNRAIEPAAVPMTPDTIFDLASITKVVSTATSIMILADRGRLAITDTVATHLPEFGTKGKEKITIEDLLLHRSGLTADNLLRDYTMGRNQAWLNICGLPLTAPVGKKFIYSDVGYIVLGEMVERIEGKRISHFAAESIFVPLRMKDTTYKPSPDLKDRIAPTEQRDGHWLVGQVHDPRAYWFEGVAGHAGLFGTADDLARYCRMILHDGELDGNRILSRQKAAEMIQGRRLPDGSGGRAYGWDIDTTAISPRGDLYPRGRSFGHTGFTGTSIWIDPASQSFVIFLSSRLHPTGKGNVSVLRHRIATIAAQAIGLQPMPTVSP